MWRPHSIDERLVGNLAAQLGISAGLARVLIARGYGDAQCAAAFLNPSLADLHPVASLPDVGPAVERTIRAIRAHETILIWGHEDLDGVSSVVCLRQTLEALRGVTRHYIPVKGAERHGLNPVKARELARDGVKLIITVDCGITNIAEVGETNQLGIDVIITDHHEVLDRLPPAIAVVDAKRPDSRYPFRNLAGVGTALKMALAVADELPGVSPEQFFSVQPELLTMVALGTIADRVPLIDENRILVRHGLEQMHRSRLAALMAVLETCGIRAADLTVNRVVNDLMPLFASADGNTGVEMFLTDDMAVTRDWARTLWDQHQAWREEARETLRLAEQLIDLAAGIIFVRSEKLSLRALGHCAARIKDEYLLPVVVMGRRGDNWVGECRGVEGVNLVDLLKANAKYFRDYGGHAKACGFTVPDDCVEPFIADSKEYAAVNFVGRITETRELVPEAGLELAAIADDLRRLAPFGEGNPRPLLVAADTRLDRQGTSITCPAAPHLRFDDGSTPLPGPGNYDLLYELDENLLVQIKALNPTLHAN